MILFWILGEKKYQQIVGEDHLNQLNEDYRTVNDLKNNEIFPKAIKN